MVGRLAEREAIESKYSPGKIVLASLVGLVCWTALSHTSALAASLSDLTERADAVAVAPALEWSTDSAGSMTIVLRIDRVLFKGTLNAGAVVLANADARGAATVRAVRTESPLGVWFLKKEGNSWSVIPARGGPGVGFRDMYYPLRPNDVPTSGDQLSQEAVVLSIARSQLASGTHPWFIREAIGTYDSPGVRAFLTEMSERQDALYGLVGLSELLARGDISALSRVRQSVELVRLVPPDGFGKQLVPQTIDGYFRNTDPVAVHLLGQLANDESLEEDLREAAAHALANIHTRESLLYLAGLLDSKNPNLRKSGVIGLGFFANGVGVQHPSDGPSMKHLNQATVNQYSSEETARFLGYDESRDAEFVAFWRDWWLRNQDDFR